MKSEKFDQSKPEDVCFLEDEGVAFFAHLLRRVSDRLVVGFEEWYQEIGIEVPVRAASTLRVLHRTGPLPVTGIARKIDQSHPLVINRVRQLEKLCLVTTVNDASDRRVTLVALTERGSDAAASMITADKIIEAAYTKLFKDADADCFDALWRIEAACRAKDMGKRLREEFWKQKNADENF